jgi:hypothetical protein
MQIPVYIVDDSYNHARPAREATNLYEFRRGIDLRPESYICEVEGLSLEKHLTTLIHNGWLYFVNYDCSLVDLRRRNEIVVDLRRRNEIVNIADRVLRQRRDLAQAGIILPISHCSSVFCAAPAPSIGTGVPLALAAGGVMRGMMLVKFWRRS